MIHKIRGVVHLLRITLSRNQFVTGLTKSVLCVFHKLKVLPISFTMQSWPFATMTIIDNYAHAQDKNNRPNDVAELPISDCLKRSYIWIGS